MEVLISGLAKAKMGVQHNEIDYDKWASVMEDASIREMRIRHEELIRAWDEYMLWLRENDPAMWETYKIAMGFWDEIKEFGPDSYIGRCASVIMGSTETTFYTLSVYLSNFSGKCYKILLCSLVADMAVIVCTGLIV